MTPIRSKPTQAMYQVELSDEEFEKYCGLIYRMCGIRVPENKRVMISNRVRRRLRATSIKTFADYYSFLVSPKAGSEMPLFLDAITTNETYFFRDMHHYDWLADQFLPEIVQQAHQRLRARSLRIWSAACSTGEEPYSIALKLAARKHEFSGWKLQIMGTDLSGAVLSSARAAEYDDRAVHLVSPDDRKRYFEADPQGNRWTLNPEVRSLVTFKPHNLMYPLREEPFDCIFLKNVLIYFDNASKQTVVKNVISALAKGGRLVIGPTEGIYAMLDPLTKLKPWLYQRPA
jgi:chemotaxis protein methyltransferase CheR